MADFADYEFPDQELTVFTVRGVPKPGEILGHAQDHFKRTGGRSRRVLWDMREASFLGIPPETLVANVAKASKLTQEGYRTAFVLPGDTDYGLGRLLESHLEVRGLTALYRPFRTMEDAQNWLLGDED